jgi:hypothetical protein
MREGLLILGDHLPNPHTGAKATSAQRHRQIVELGVRAEALGFDSVWLDEHHLCDHGAADSQTARARWRPYHLQYIRWVTTVLVPWGGVNLSPREERAAGMPASLRCTKGSPRAATATDPAR